MVHVCACSPAADVAAKSIALPVRKNQTLDHARAPAIVPSIKKILWGLEAVQKQSRIDGHACLYAAPIVFRDREWQACSIDDANGVALAIYPVAYFAGMPPSSTAVRGHRAHEKAQLSSIYAVAVGFIALAGVAAETGVVMLIYLDQAMREIKKECEAEGADCTKADLHGRSCSARSNVRPEDDDGYRDHGGACADPLERGSRIRSSALVRTRNWLTISAVLSRSPVFTARATASYGRGFGSPAFAPVPDACGG